MPAGEYHVNDYGTQFQFGILDQNSNPINISSATVKQVMFQAPDSTTFVRNLTFLSDGSDGNVLYITGSGEFNLVGQWQFQCYISTPSSTFFSDITKFEVYENLYNWGRLQSNYLN